MPWSGYCSPLPWPSRPHLSWKPHSFGLHPLLSVLTSWSQSHHHVAQNSSRTWSKYQKSSQVWPSSNCRSLREKTQFHYYKTLSQKQDDQVLLQHPEFTSSLYMHTLAPPHTHTHAHAHTHTYTCTHTHMNKNIYTCTNIYTGGGDQNLLGVHRIVYKCQNTEQKLEHPCCSLGSSST